MYDFDNTIVRILEMTLKNYKNVSNGTAEIGSIPNIEDEKSDILGIYGQNGSGKTSIISAISIIKDMFSGKSLPNDIGEYITHGKEEAEIEILFFIKKESIKYKVKYHIVFAKDRNSTFTKKESIDYWDKIDTDDNWNKVKTLITNEHNEEKIIPKYRNEELISLYGEEEFLINKQEKLEKSKSIIFSEELIKKIGENPSKLGREYEILNILHDYANLNLFIIDNNKINLNYIDVLVPINFRENGNMKYDSKEAIKLGMSEPFYLDKDVAVEIEKSFHLSNKVISEIIPELEIQLRYVDIEEDKLGDKVLVELLSCRDGMEIPMRYESDGIKKIIAAVHLLIAMFNYRSITVLIDELDAGIFEYLLGEILEILEERGKGQLIFTCHNLRPLEVLDKNNLLFTTTNINNRYIKLKNVKTNNNLRDMYYRDIVLGGQDEIIYDTTKSAKIARAFRKAGR